jgi:hypothetical protein
MNGPDDRLAALLADALHRLDEAAGGAAVCGLTKAGVAVPGIKYAEGRWAALREVERERGRGADVTATADAATAEASATALVVWSDALERAVATSAGADWLAYRHGGVDALTDLLA